MMMLRGGQLGKRACELVRRGVARSVLGEAGTADPLVVATTTTTATTSSSWTFARGYSGLVGMPGEGGWQSPPSPTTLDKVVKLETFAGQSREYIERTWMKFHEDERMGRIGHTLTRNEYKRLLRNAQESPIFVVPLEKPEGYVTLVVQWQLQNPQSKLALFTSLEEFQGNSMTANSHLTLTHYTELAKKDIVLVRGDVSSPKLINAFEARMLTKRVYDHYLHPEKYARWVKTFNHASSQFDFKAYIKHLGFLA